VNNPHGISHAGKAIRHKRDRLFLIHLSH